MTRTYKLPGHPPVESATSRVDRLPNYTDDMARAGDFDPDSAQLALDFNYGRKRVYGHPVRMTAAEILDAHYIQADRADEARAGAQLVREIDGNGRPSTPTAGPQERDQLLDYATRTRRARVARARATHGNAFDHSNCIPGDPGCPFVGGRNLAALIDADAFGEEIHRG